MLGGLVLRDVKLQVPGFIEFVERRVRDPSLLGGGPGGKDVPLVGVGVEPTLGQPVFAHHLDPAALLGHGRAVVQGVKDDPPLRGVLPATWELAVPDLVHLALWIFLGAETTT